LASLSIFIGSAIDGQQLLTTLAFVAIGHAFGTVIALSTAVAIAFPQLFNSDLQGHHTIVMRKK